MGVCLAADSLDEGGWESENNVSHSLSVVQLRMHLTMQKFELDTEALGANTRLSLSAYRPDDSLPTPLSPCLGVSFCWLKSV